MLLNRGTRTIPNMLVASLAISDFRLGALSLFPLALPTICEYQGYIIITRKH